MSTSWTLQTPGPSFNIMQANKIGQVTALPNSSSTVIALLSTLAVRHKLVVGPVAPDVYNSYIEIVVTTDIDIPLDKAKISFKALVSKALSEEQSLLGWRTMRDLSIIPCIFSIHASRT